MNNAGVQNSSLAELHVPDGFVFGAGEGGSLFSAAPVVDAELLFSGHYSRAGADLIISNETQNVTIPEYFKGEQHPALMSPEGASLSGRIIDAMTAGVRYAQADQIASAVPAVGNVARLAGIAVVTRNGVTVDLKQGDRLLKGDVVQTDADTALGITFVDGTALGLASNARIVLDEMTYDPNGSSNSSLLSLVQGTITLVAGHTAKFGNMRVETPVATMGIRGTAILVEIAADDGPTRFSVLKEPDGKTGAFNLYDKATGELIRVVSHAGFVTLVSPLGPGQPVSAIDQLKTLADLQNEKNIVQQVFQLYFPNYSPDSHTGSSSNALANMSVSDAGQPIQSVVPGLIALTGGVAIIPVSAAPQDLLIFPETPPAPAVTTIAVMNVVDVQASPGPVERNFSISDQVAITIDGQVIGESAGRYVPGTGAVTGVKSTAPTPLGVNLANLVHVDPASGVVTYDSSAFTFLGVGESVIYTIGFGSRSGASVVPETLTLTVNGLNDPPAVEHSIPDQHIRDGCRFEYVIPACVFSDPDTNDVLTYRATLANGDPLPNWLTFDPETLTFSGTPPKGDDCVLHLAVIASDEHDATAVDRFDLVITDDHHRHHRPDDYQIKNAPMASHENDFAGAGGDGSSQTGDAVSSQGDIHSLTAAGEFGCGCSHGSARAGNENSILSGVSVSFEHRSHGMSFHHENGNGDARGHDSILVPVSRVFVSNDSPDLHTGWPHATVNYAGGSKPTHDDFAATSQNFTFAGEVGSGNSHRDAAGISQRVMSGMDGFVFSPDLGRHMSGDARPAPDTIHADGSWFGNMIDPAAFAHVTENFDHVAAHDESATVLRQFTSAAIHAHHGDYHLA